jgi:hypothetical protein
MIFVFDIDNTLTPPRAAMLPEFAAQFLSFCRSEIVYLVTGSDRGKVDEQVPAILLRPVPACSPVPGPNSKPQAASSTATITSFRTA